MNIELRDLDQNKRWSSELNKWREENRETLLKLDVIDQDTMLMNWMMNKLDEYEEHLDSNNAM